MRFPGNSVLARVAVPGCIAVGVLLTSCAEVPTPARHTASEPASAPVAGVEFGARTPFTTCEAEDPANVTTGVIRVMGEPIEPSPEREASGYGYVELNRTGQYLDFATLPAADGIVVRHCIPDAPEGGGQSATLGLYINGERRLSLTLSSHHNWLYSKTSSAGENGQSNTPTAFPHVFWDESRFIVPGGIKPGDRVRLQKDATDTADFYRIDLIDAEPVAPPLERPAQALAITDFGAAGKDAATDTAAILACLAAARERHLPVWLPPGRFLVNASLPVDGLVVSGAGMWYTTVAFTELPRTWTGVFNLQGTGDRVSDLTIEGPSTARTEPLHGFSGLAHDWRVERVWITHTNTAFWIAGEDGVISHCRVRFTYADGINVNNGKSAFARRILIEDNHVRGCGDDSIAILCHEPTADQRAEDRRSEQVTIRHNTTVAPWWAANCDLAGGRGHVIEDNLFTGNGLVVNLPAAYPMQPQGAAVIRHNLLRRCGNDYRGQRRGALWIYAGSTTISDLQVTDNRIEEPLFAGVELQGKMRQTITFRNNLIRNSGGEGFRIGTVAQGEATFSGNQVTGLKPGMPVILNAAGEAFTIHHVAGDQP
jgi:hypothetical protein